MSARDGSALLDTSGDGEQMTWLRAARARGTASGWFTSSEDITVRACVRFHGRLGDREVAWEAASCPQDVIERASRVTDGGLNLQFAHAEEVLVEPGRIDLPERCRPLPDCVLTPEEEARLRG